MLHCDLDEEIYRDKVYDFKIINKAINVIIIFIILIIFYNLIKLIFYL